MAKGESYEEFVKKFEMKKTTDDCYTPAAVYDVVKAWAMAHAAEPFTEAQIVRPFWPGGDYENEDYRGRVVVDNPPFSILARIVRTYLARGVRFFLFAPSQTLYSMRIRPGRVTFVASHCRVRYANGAKVNTAFVTNLLPRELAVVTDAQLVRDVERASRGGG